MNIKYAGMALVAFAVAATLFLAFRDRDEARIQQTVNKMVDAFRKVDKEGLVDAARRSQFFAQQFVPQPVIAIEGFDMPLATQNDLQSAVFQVRAASQTIQVKLFDRELDLTPDRRSADLRFAARAQFGVEGSVETAAYQFHLHWIKTDAGWKIDLAEAVEANE